MKRFLAALVLCSTISCGHALADAFTLEEVEVQPTTYSTTSTQQNAAQINIKDRAEQYSRQNVKLQDAVLKIESAQTDVKTQLAEYEAKLTEIKTRQDAVKEERRSMEQNIRDVKKRMRSLESAMKKINSNMEAAKVESL